MRNLIVKLLSIFKKRSQRSRDDIRLSLSRSTDVKNSLVPKVKGYKLEDLFVAKVIRVDYIDGEDDEFEDFDYETKSGETPPPITKDDYHVSTVERLVILRPAIFDGEEKEYYDIFTGYGYDEFDFTSDTNEEYVDNIISAQTWFKHYFKAHNVKVFPKIGYKDIINMSDVAIQYINDLEEAENNNVIENLDDILDRCVDFEQLFKVWYIVMKAQIKCR